ncbi:MAG: class I SAM-dependent methyltransferase, partial [Desulfobulbaceae bacterium]|nr:class I SAM-dependent methyltransferase [Desulfobulbaceae bacterium]
MCDRKLLIRGLNQLGVNLDDKAIDQVLLYCQELLKWNKRINLIARNTQPAEVIEKHFLDSLTLLPVIKQYSGANPTLLDIGTGAGFPGLVLAAVMPELQVTLVEPRQKRVSFLR